jgi:hypothetical protein
MTTCPILPLASLAVLSAGVCMALAGQLSGLILTALGLGMTVVAL